MAVTHPTDVRNTLADTVVDLIDAGAGAGSLVLQTSTGGAVATLTFSDPAFGAAAAGTATANSITDDTNAAGGTITQAVAQDSNSSQVFSCSVSTSGAGGDIEMDSTVISAGQTVSISSLTYSAPL